MVFLPFRAVVGIGIQKNRVVRGKIGRNENMVTICYSTELLQCRVELQCRVATVTDNKICFKTARICFKRLYWVLGL